jgi:hypothetical protein
VFPFSGTEMAAHLRPHKHPVVFGVWGEALPHGLEQFHLALNVLHCPFHTSFVLSHHCREPFLATDCLFKAEPSEAQVYQYAPVNESHNELQHRVIMR